MPTATRAPSEPRISVSVHLPASLLAAYQDEAAALGVLVADIIERRLKSSREHRATKPLYFDDDQRRALESLLDQNVTTPAEVISLMRDALSVSIADLMIPLPPALLDRLRSRFFGQPNEWNDFVRGVIFAGLEEYVGLR